MPNILPDSLVWEHLGEQSIENQQLQSSHAQAITGNKNGSFFYENKNGSLIHHSMSWLQKIK